MWTEEIKLKSLNEIPNLLASDKNDAIHYEKRNGDETTQAIAKTCYDFFRLTKEDYSRESNREIAVEGFFIRECIPLKYLQEARPAKYSYLRQFNMQKDYGRLPAGLVIYSKWEDDPFGTIKKTYSDIEEEKESLPTSILLHSEEAGVTVELSLIALGDFNRDGYDDMIISVSQYCYKFKGTYHAYSIYILTQKQKDGPFEEINENALIGLKN